MLSNDELATAIAVASTATKAFTDNEEARALWVDHLRKLLAVQFARTLINEDAPIDSSGHEQVVTPEHG